MQEIAIEKETATRRGTKPEIKNVPTQKVIKIWMPNPMEVYSGTRPKNGSLDFINPPNRLIKKYPTGKLINNR